MEMNNEKELELGKYLESDMIELKNDVVAGGGTPLIDLSVIIAYISNNTCPSTACTRDY